MLQRTNIYLPSDMIQTLKAKARRKDSSMSDVVREALEKEINIENTGWAQSLLALSKKAKGSGLRDLSRRHDYYLYVEPYLRRRKRDKKK